MCCQTGSKFLLVFYDDIQSTGHVQEKIRHLASMYYFIFLIFPIGEMSVFMSNYSCCTHQLLLQVVHIYIVIKTPYMSREGLQLILA